MHNIKDGSFWQVFGPASVYDETGLGIEALLVGLDRKLTRLAEGSESKNACRRFRAWFREMRPDILALIFHAGEIVSDADGRISMHVICGNSLTEAMTQSIIDGRMDILSSSVSDYATLADVCTEDGGSHWRAFFSSELLIAARSPNESQMLNMHFLSVHDIFEDGNVLDDVGLLISLDVHEKILSKGCSQGSKSKSETIDMRDDELTSLAIEAMKRRRVNPAVHQKVLPIVRKTFSAMDSNPRSKSYL